jgi:hypothetical protein
MWFIDYASFFNYSKHVMASVRHFDRIMRRHDSLESSVVIRQRGA